MLPTMKRLFNALHALTGRPRVPSKGPLWDRYAAGNERLAKSIARRSAAERLKDQREQAPEASRLLRSLAPLIIQGANGLEIQEHLLNAYLERGWRPMLVGYCGYPAAVPVSVNYGVGGVIPTDKPIPEAALVKVELIAGTPVSHLAQTWTFAGRNATPLQLFMLDKARLALRKGIEPVRHGARIDTIGDAISKVLDENDLFPIRELCGYTMGAQRVEAPQILGYGLRGIPSPGTCMEAGQVLNIQVLAQRAQVRTRLRGEEGFQYYTGDRGDAVVLSAMVEVTETGHRLLTEFVD